MNISNGIKPHAIKAVLYGTDGIGKTTFASKAPYPLFIDTEESTKDINVRRVDPSPKTWMELANYVMEVRNSDVELCKTLVIDTADWAERMCIKHICDKNQKSGIEDWGYGKGYTYVYEEFGKLLNALTDIVNKGINVILIAHAALKKFEQPDENGAYDRYTLKLNDTPKTSIANMVREWADLVLFANYKTYVVDVEGKKKAQGGQRVMYTTHHPAWDAKNRFGLPDELPFEFDQIARLFLISDSNPKHEQKPVKEASSFDNDELPFEISDDLPFEITDDAEKKCFDPQITDPNFPEKLLPLMMAKAVTEADIRKAVASKGICPEDMLVSKYPPQFIDGMLIAQFDKVYDQILINRKAG
jgi:hypothetical protein